MTLFTGKYWALIDRVFIVSDIVSKELNHISTMSYPNQYKTQKRRPANKPSKNGYFC